jgi:hypothetical protein
MIYENVPEEPIGSFVFENSERRMETSSDGTSGLLFQITYSSIWHTFYPENEKKRKTIL